MKPPSPTGMKDAGQPLKKSSGRRTDHRLGRRSGLLSLANGSTYLGTMWADSYSARPAHAGSSLGNEWHHSRWAVVSASAFGFLRCSQSGGRISRVLLRTISGKLLL